jgi:hypothetical protein
LKNEKEFIHSWLSRLNRDISFIDWRLFMGLYSQDSISRQFTRNVLRLDRFGNVVFSDEIAFNLQRSWLNWYNTELPGHSYRTFHHACPQ